MYIYLFIFEYDNGSGNKKCCSKSLCNTSHFIFKYIISCYLY